MNSARCVGAVALPVLLACVLTGCAGGDAHHGSGTPGPVNPLLASPSPTSASPTSPAAASFLFTGQADVDYLQWQADPAGALQGTELSAKVTGRYPDAEVSVQQSSFSGRVGAGAVTLTASGGNARGTLTDAFLTMSSVAEDGSIQPQTYHRATDADYNAALGGLRVAVQKANAAQDRADTVASAEQALSRDGESLNDAQATLDGDVSGITDDLSGMASDVASARTDEQGVLGEATGSDTSGVCGDAAGVAGDAAGISGDAAGIASDVAGVRTDMGTLHDRATTVATDLQDLLDIEPSYAGGDGGPSPADVHRALADAEQTAAGDVAKANGYADQANASVTTAFGYAAAASRAGSCGSTDQPPAPIAHITSPFTENDVWSI